MINRRILPRCPHLVDQWNAQPPPDAQRGNGIQDRRVRMQNVRPYTPGNLLDAMGYFTHQLNLRNPWYAVKQSTRRRRAIEMPAVHLFFLGRYRPLFGSGEMKRFPTQRALLLENRERAECVTAVQRDRV